MSYGDGDYRHGAAETERQLFQYHEWNVGDWDCCGAIVRRRVLAERFLEVDLLDVSDVFHHLGMKN
jgi:hypothetical protein